MRQKQTALRSNYLNAWTLQMHNQLQRRMFLTGSAALGIASFTPGVSFADTVPATATGPALIAAAEKEGKVVWYTSVDLPVAEKVAEASRPNIQLFLFESSATAQSACSSAL